MRFFNFLRIIGIFLTITLLPSCTYVTQGLPDEDRGALANADDYFGDKATSIVYPDQNWDAGDSLWFYNTSQGSNLMDYQIFLNLELASSERLFRSHENMGKYRNLLQKPTWDNPDSLPVGWVKDSYEGNDYVGFTCAACHTTQVNYKGLGIRIDGGPAMTDVWTMFEDLEEALKASLPESKFSKLADRILKGESSDNEKRKNLYNRLVRDYEKIRDYNKIDQPPTIPHYGYARLDAFGRIFNRAMDHLDSSHRGRPANAPVSFPFLWDTPQHDFVQWNGIADNGSALGLGPLGRNTGEVVGVFASVQVVKEGDSEKPSYSVPSSARTLNQVRLEDHLKDLWSPSWEQLAKDQVLPNIDQAMVTQGKELFKIYCQACHSDIKRDDENRLVIAQFTSVDMIGTDPVMATNALTYCGPNTDLRNINFDMCAGELNDPLAVTGKSAMTEITTRVMTDGLFRKIVPFIQAIWSNPWKDTETRRHIDFDVANKGYLFAYKGRPLNGIWATAPFLHNGSVPNLYELLLPSSCEDGKIPGKTCRSKTFTVGNRELDTVNVGFMQNNGDPGLFVFDTSLPGNSNKGHEYAAGVTPMIETDTTGKSKRTSDGELVVNKLDPLNHDDRMALIEYLKTL